MHFVVIGLSHKTAPVEIREKVSFSTLDQKRALKTLLDSGTASEAMILSTCNRVEIHALMPKPDAGTLKRFLVDFHPQAGSLDEYLYSHIDIDAVRHVCMVAAGLDSMVVGEPQIFGQIKDAVRSAVAEEIGQPALKRIFDRIFSIVKKVRSKTKIGELPVSVSYAAVKLAQSLFGTLTGKRVLLLGAGDMGALTLRNLMSHGVQEVYVANRTFQKAVEVSEQFNGTPIMIHELAEYIPKVDILICSLTVPDFFLRRSDLQTVLEERKGLPLFIIDISVPRSLDPAIGTLGNARLYNIDNLHAISQDNTRKRQAEIEKSMMIIEQGAAEILQKGLVFTDGASPLDFMRAEGLSGPVAAPPATDIFANVKHASAAPKSQNVGVRIAIKDGP
ncbi:MAG: glutamyl-tRNA reductase, partial [Chitinivibrionales bacterium]|nr:glutamyl-tRNA reductase [Chitinivibrionales bacterium]